MRYGNVIRLILTTIGIAGIVIVAATCPNIGTFIPRRQRCKYKPRAIQDGTRRLLRKGWIVVMPGSRLMLTDKGYEELLALEFEAKLTQKQAWDHKWRFIFFDIREQKRTVRDRLRYLLKRYGFKQLQRSVWVYPHECRDIFGLVRMQQRVQHDALYCEILDSHDTKSLHRLFTYDESIKK